MFELKGRHYKVEYKGLHLLCLKRGSFDHYLEGCPKKGKNTEVHEGKATPSRSVVDKVGQIEEEGAWIVVQKIRRPRKGKEGIPQVENQVIMGNVGSRFALLTADNAQEVV